MRKPRMMPSFLFRLPSVIWAAGIPSFEAYKSLLRKLASSLLYLQKDLAFFSVTSLFSWSAKSYVCPFINILKLSGGIGRRDMSLSGPKGSDNAISSFLGCFVVSQTIWALKLRRAK